MFQEIIAVIQMFYEFFGVPTDYAKGSAIFAFYGGVLFIAVIAVLLVFKLVTGKKLEDL